ncbi:hypothetical protein QJ850_gp286 [Acanthamoeba polyphaga mimivirus]|uniref:BTB domain-containing protein n=1 Tax=Acanthamoeba polyphaga mimivirus Kroon TaxID=3069720 RepID=A0A0G2Y3P3_9VIRU|nr:hypothetical protein QJ850_gp286 [Acanthamoeba polyphaga mimivirus]AKI80413.1 hypothetical protein [Acanthamoeba polyphaga mimivirus Kroon]
MSGHMDSKICTVYTTDGHFQMTYQTIKENDFFKNIFEIVDSICVRMNSVEFEHVAQYLRKEIPKDILVNFAYVVKNFGIDFENIVYFNIGGKIFSFEKDFIAKKFKYFERFIANYPELSPDYTSILIDKSYNKFQQILDFIKNQESASNQEHPINNDLEIELEYYGWIPNENIKEFINVSYFNFIHEGYVAFVNHWDQRKYVVSKHSVINDGDNNIYQTNIHTKEHIIIILCLKNNIKKVDLLSKINVYFSKENEKVPNEENYHPLTNNQFLHKNKHQIIIRHVLSSEFCIDFTTYSYYMRISKDLEIDSIKFYCINNIGDYYDIPNKKFIEYGKDEIIDKINIKLRDLIFSVENSIFSYNHLINRGTRENIAKNYVLNKNGYVIDYLLFEIPTEIKVSHIELKSRDETICVSKLEEITLVSLAEKFPNYGSRRIVPVASNRPTKLYRINKLYNKKLNVNFLLSYEMFCEIVIVLKEPSSGWFKLKYQFMNYY